MTAVDLHDETSCPAHPDTTRRRAILGVAVAVGAACAGCASSKSSSSAAANPPATSAGSAGSSADAAASPSPGGSASATDSTTSAGATGSTAASGSSGTTGAAAALAATSAVPVGGGTVLTQQAIVLTQPTAGTYKAFTAVCTHMGCTVSSVQNGLIVCPCHGSSYHIADGSVANGPATQPLAAIAVKVSGGQITKA